MFDSLSGRLGQVFDGLTRRGALGEAEVARAMRDVRIALLEADVALPVVKDFTARVAEEAVGAAVLESVAPGQQVVKIVNDRLVEMLGGTTAEIDIAAAPPAAVLMVGLQGSGKTTTTAKLGRFLSHSRRKRVLMASLDTRRPAAMEQLSILGGQAAVDVLPVTAEQDAVAIARRAMKTGAREGYDVVLLDTAGRTHADAALMTEVEAVRDACRPAETLLVADALTGQDAVNVARAFDERVGLSGIALTRVDGDGRGGAALSMRAVTGRPIKLIGTGEGLDAIEPFHPDRIASRILGMGDVVSLVEKAQESIDRKEAAVLARKARKGGFDLDDLSRQIDQMRRMGGMEGLLGMLPGVGRVKKQLADANVDLAVLDRNQAIIGSMTPAERRNPKLLNGSRKRRIAGGSGTSVQDVNRLLKQVKQMNVMMKRAGKLGEKGLARAGMPGLALPR